MHLLHHVMTCAAAWPSKVLIKNLVQHARLPMCTPRHSSKALPGEARQLKLTLQELRSACALIEACLQHCNPVMATPRDA